jgi:hypothetical protein
LKHGDTEFIDSEKADDLFYPHTVLSSKMEDILTAFKTAGNNLTATSLSSGYIIAPAVPHIIMNAFKNLAFVSFSINYSLPLAEHLRGNAATSAPFATTAAKVETKAAAPVKE